MQDVQEDDTATWTWTLRAVTDAGDLTIGAAPVGALTFKAGAELRDAPVDSNRDNVYHGYSGCD